MKVLGVAMWMLPRHVEWTESWDEWLQGWLLWGRQVGMNLWWGRGGLNVEVRFIHNRVGSDVRSRTTVCGRHMLTAESRGTTSGSKGRLRLKLRCGMIPKDTTFATL